MRTPGGRGALRRHAGAYAVVACVLSAANWHTGAPWWSFWPLAIWGVALGVHYLIHKTQSVDAAWVEERTAELHSRSYDAGHIDRICADQDANCADREAR
ncbi:MAG: 2TM domain-containing protein [Betaproteobacteria bacterium]|nr:2TM domain-containing protein [Betaproteobacteria bacterium]MBM3354453.1 2TM domain-containing protein [Betaproteobacteria bacterium]MBM3384850.1 2TM domain-containing protein [Betaproteobacteria bacterium]